MMNRRMFLLAIAAQSATWQDEAFSPLNGSLAPAKAKGPFKLGKLIGRTLAVNQLLITPAFTTQTVDGVTFTNNGNGSITVSGTATADITFTIEGNLSRNIPLGHKVLMTNFSNPNHATYYLQDAYEGNMTWALRDTPYGYIKSKEGSSTTISPRIYVMNGVTVNETITPKYYDLTLMFGPGREPSTVDEFKKVYSRENTAYTLGQLESSTVTSIIARKTDSTEKSRLTLPNDLTLKSALDAKDEFEIVGSNAVFTKNIGTVDLGTLDYEYSANAFGGSFRATLSGLSSKGLYGTPDNITCQKYINVARANLASNDKGIASQPSIVFIHDTSYTDPVTFKTAMAGQYINYELATPQTITIPLKKLQAVTVGELSWEMAETDTTGHTFLCRYLTSMKPAGSQGLIPNLVTDYYKTTPNGYISVVLDSRDKCIYLQPLTNERVFIRDSAYSTVADFLAAHRDDVIWFESVNDQLEWNAGTCEAGGEFETGYVSPDAVLKIYEKK